LSTAIRVHSSTHGASVIVENMSIRPKDPGLSFLIVQFFAAVKGGVALRKQAKLGV